MYSRKAVASQIAIGLVRVPYIWGGNDPDDPVVPGLDCSGFVRYILRQVGVLPLTGDWTSNSFWNRFESRGKIVQLPTEGTLTFYGSLDQAINHVMYNLSPVLAIGAVGGNSKTISTQIARSRGAGVHVRPINYRTDIVGYADPFLKFEEE